MELFLGAVTVKGNISCLPVCGGGGRACVCVCVCMCVCACVHECVCVILSMK